MTALYIILGIIAFFVIVLSIPVVLDLEYTDAVRCKVSWLFLKFDIYPFPEKKKKEEKPKKETKENATFHQRELNFPCFLLSEWVKRHKAIISVTS